MEICPAYILKIKLNYEKQIIILMIPNREKELVHYLVVKKLSELLRGITSKNNADFYCLNCCLNCHLHVMKKYVKIKIFVELLCQLNKILKYNQYMKSDKTTCIVYVYL